MFDAKLIVNGQEFPIHYKMLNEIASNVPSSSHYAPLAQALLALGIPSITRELIGNDVLSVEDLDTIWEMGNIDLQRRLADVKTFRKNLTDAQAEQIISINDSAILKELARYAEDLYPMKGEKQAMRLSGKMADALLECMLNHADEGVRRRLGENAQAPAKFRPPLAEIARKGSLMWGTDVSGLTIEDLEVLKNTSLENLKTVASSVEDIEDRKARAEVIDFLCSCEDPEIRLELAENSFAPKSALRRLADDPDLDVAQAALDNLQED